jgi:hypothetical protein
MRLWPRHTGNLVLAVVLACLVWYINALDRRERISERQIDSPVSLVNITAGLVVTSEVPRFLSLRLRGPLGQLRSLEANATGVVIDLRGVGEGLHEVVVEARNVVAPEGAQVLVISPPQLVLRLERISRRAVPIKPRVAGEPGPGFAIGDITSEPARALVEGPLLQLEALPGVPTDPVIVEGAEGPVEALVAVRSPQPMMRIVEPASARVVVKIVSGRPAVSGGRRD